ncbi:GNAT family N-acetyltransferase [Streptomyces sp. SID4931]|nr:GNAT family N-acetyltransferase [Streptomyces sp. SID4931]
MQLRDVVPEDLEVFLAYEHDPEAVRRSRFAPREREAFMAHWRTRVLGDPGQLRADGRRGRGDRGEHRGLVGGGPALHRLLVRPCVLGRGIGTGALTAFLERETARPLYADPAVGNTGSVRLLEKCGFTATGTVRHGEDEHVMLVRRRGRVTDSPVRGA